MYREGILIKIGYDLKQRGYASIPRLYSNTYRLPVYMLPGVVVYRADSATRFSEYYLLDDILILDESLIDVRGWQQLIEIGMAIPSIPKWLEVNFPSYDFPVVLTVNNESYLTHTSNKWYNWCYADNISTVFLWNRIPELSSLEFKKLTQGDWDI